MAKETLGDKIAALNPREKKMLAAMALIMPILLMVVIIGFFNRSLGGIEDQTHTYQGSLELLAEGGPKYYSKQSRSDDGGVPTLFTDEIMTDNPVKLTSFIAARASEAGVNPNSYDSEDIAIGSSSSSKDTPTVTEKKLTVDIREAEIDKLLEFLQVIETSGEPVVIKRVDLRGNARSPGVVRARVEVSTYIKPKQES